MPRKACNFLGQFVRVTLFCGVSGLLNWLFPFFPVGASDRTPGVFSASRGVHRDANLSPIITIQEAKDLINLLPATKDLRTKGMDVRWDLRAVPDMNNRDYYFFWIYNATAQKEHEISS